MSGIEKRLTERMNRARLAVEVKRSIRPLAFLAVGAVVGLAAWLVIISNVGTGALRQRHIVRFTVPSASSVTAGRNPVMLRGVEIGTINKVAIKHGAAVLTTDLQSRYGPIYRNARAELRPGTALENMYLDIVDRGTPGAGAATADQPLPATQTQVAVQAEEVLSAFAPTVRRRLAVTLRELGGGLSGRGADLREAFVQVVPFLESVAGVSRQLGVRADLTRRLVTSTATLTAELGRRDRELRRLVTEGALATTTLARSSGALDATLQRLPPALRELDSSFAAVRGVVGDVDTALSDLKPVADRLPGALSSLRRLSGDADPALQRLRQPVRRLTPLASALRPLSAQLHDGLRALAPQVGDVNHVTNSIAGCTYAINAFFQWTASVAKFDDGRGLFPRGNAVMSLNSAGGLKEPNTYPAPGCSPGLPKVDTP
ncbi:MAG: Mammalian cell entry related domain protein [Conexibacter sp.]|nr:Mammalian cell entry related domain protein [Conexibacter sp.]